MLYTSVKRNELFDHNTKINPLYDERIIPFEEECRICLEGGNLVQVCKCKGTMKYVHLECNQKWRNNFPKKNIKYTHCEICKSKYIIDVDQSDNPFIYICYYCYWLCVILIILFIISLLIQTSLWL